MSLFNDSVSHKKKFLSSLIKAPLEQLSRQCSETWNNTDELNSGLKNELCKLPHCQLLYAVDTCGKQLTANITRNQVDNTWRGQDLSSRPYLKGSLPYRGMTLSAAYLSMRSMQPCLTAIQAVRKNDQLLGFIAADFHLKDLPHMTPPALQRVMRQPLGDTAPIARIASSLDDNLDYLSYVLITLLQDHGVFQCQLHFSTSRCVLWSFEHPTHYRLHTVDELLLPELFMQYPKQPYNKSANVNPDTIPLVLAQFKALREANDSNYLRTASLNIVNGLVSLTFASDGTHYVTTEEFLNRELHHWLGKSGILIMGESVQQQN